jgi:hypothetical protein
MDSLNQNQDFKEIRGIVESIRNKIKKPTAWRSIKSNSPYYRSAYAEWIKPTLDAMIEDPERFPQFSCDKMGLKLNSLYNKILQSWLFLMDYHDIGSKYKILRQQVLVIRDGNRVILKWKKGARTTPGRSSLDDAVFSMNDGEIITDVPWKEALENYLETSEVEGSTFELSSLLLTDIDITYINTIVDSAEVFAVVSLDETGFKIIKSKVLAKVWRASL